MLEEEGPESPPLDLTDAAVLGLLHSAKKRGYVTNDQNALLSSAEVKSEQIEDILAKFSEMGVHVVGACVLDSRPDSPETGGIHDRQVAGTNHRCRHASGVRAGVGRVEVDDVAKGDFARLELFPTDSDGLESEWALAESGEHDFAASFNAFGNGHLDDIEDRQGTGLACSHDRSH
jgi:hypothetical protein